MVSIMLSTAEQLAFMSRTIVTFMSLLHMFLQFNIVQCHKSSVRYIVQRPLMMS